MSIEPTATRLPKYYKDSTEEVIEAFNPHRLEPDYSVLKQEDQHPEHRALVGEFICDTPRDALTFCKTYLSLVTMPAGESLVVVEHRTNTAFIYDPEIHDTPEE